MKRFLIYGLSNQWGGIEAIIHSMISRLESDNELDLLISGQNVDERHFRHSGNVSVLKITAWGNSRTRFRKELKAVLLNRSYDFVWVNASLMCNRDIISVVRNNSQAKIITHSHGTYLEEANKLKEYILLVMHYFNRPYFRKYVDYKCMCSNASGKWFYGSKSVEAGDVYLIKNGIDTSRFRFDESIRIQMRKDLGIRNEIVLFHAGRLTAVKNQNLLLHIVKSCIDKGINVKLLIAGDGELNQSLQNLASSLGVDNNVVFLGSRDDVHHLYQAADIFLLPSFHEGFPVTLTEAQTSGLYCLVSDYISTETNITGEIRYLPINPIAIDKWVDTIKDVSHNKQSRLRLSEKVREQRFDISDVVNDFKNHIGI